MHYSITVHLYDPGQPYTAFSVRRTRSRGREIYTYTVMYGIYICNVRNIYIIMGHFWARDLGEASCYVGMEISRIMHALLYLLL